MQAETQAVQALMPTLQNTLVIDLACGTGRWGRWAEEQGAALVLGFDNSQAMLEYTILNYTVLANMATLPLPSGQVDRIVCGLATGHLPPHAMQAAVKEMGRVLKPDGIAVLSDFHPFQAWQGAKRTFQGDDGKTYAVEHYIHSYADYHAAATEAGLQITGIREPARPDIATPSPPIVLVLRLEKRALA